MSVDVLGLKNELERLARVFEGLRLDAYVRIFMSSDQLDQLMQRALPIAEQVPAVAATVVWLRMARCNVQDIIPGLRVRHYVAFPPQVLATIIHLFEADALPAIRQGVERLSDHASKLVAESN